MRTTHRAAHAACGVVRPLFASRAAGVAWIASIVACVAGSAGAQTLFYADPAGAESLAHSNTRLVWSTADCVAGPFEVCRIRSAYGNDPLPPGVRISYDNSGGASADNIASNVASYQGYAYWLTLGGQVVRRNVSYAAASVEGLATMETPGASGEVAADGDHVWWIEHGIDSGRVFRAPIEGGPRELVAEASDSLPHDLQTDGAGAVYFLADLVVSPFCCTELLHQVAPDGLGGFVTTYSAKSFIDGYTLDENEIFVASRQNAGANLVIARSDLATLDQAASWTDLYDAGSTGPPSIRHLTLWRDDLFWHEKGPVAGSPLLRMPRTGGTPVPITSSLADARDLVVSGDYRQYFLYYRESGDIHRVPTDASTFTRDLVGDEIQIEVTQSIQDTGHTVPLVEGKETWARVYARLGAASDGATQVNLYPGVLLEGRRGGTPLEGSPLRPVERVQPILDTPVDRTKPENQFLFALPESWAQGTVTLTATVDPRDVVFETNETNNQTSRTVSFDAVGGICIDIIPILTTLGIEKGGSLGDRARTFARARSLLPTSDLVWIFRGGSPKSKPWTGDPYNMFEDDDRNEMMFHWWHDFVFAGTPSQCGPRRTIRTAVVSGSSNFGLSSGAAAIIYYLQAMTGGEPENQPPGGTSGLAHEVGHQLGQAHIGCPMSGDDAPAGPDGSYPYDACAIEDDNDHIGFDPITRKLIVPFDDSLTTSQYQDYMSYQEDYWTSDYVYREHHTELASATPSPPVSGAGPLLVAGFQRDDGSTELASAYELGNGLATAEAILGESTEPSGDYRVLIRDPNGVLLADEPLRIARTIEEEQGDPVHTSFFGLVEAHPDRFQIEILDAANNVLLVSRTYGANPPTVKFLKPLFGSPLGEAVDVAWEGSDPDGDVLEYRLLYSADGGASWSDLVTTRSSFAQVEMAGLPTGANVLFRVLASDGLRSAEAMTGPFTIPNRPPEVAILLDDHAEPAGPVGLAYGEPAVLRGVAHDSDDGPLDGASLAWTWTGPATATGAGDAFSVRDLQPGAYQVQLTATDSGALSSTALLQVTIAPRRFFSGDEVALDGRCIDSAYATDGGRMVLRYEGGEVAEGAMAQVGDQVHVCWNGLLPNVGPEYLELRVDPDASADAVMAPDDRFLRFYRDGSIESGIGDGKGGDELQSTALDVHSVVTDDGSSSWQAELRIPASLVAPRFGLGVRHVYDGGDASSWPEPLDPLSPATWPPVEMLPEPGVATSLAAGGALLALLARRRRTKR